MSESAEGFLKIIFDDVIDNCNRERILPFSNSKVYYSHVKSAIKLSKGEDVKDIYQIILHAEDIRYDFQPGDTIGILPNNNLDELNKIFKSLKCEDVIDHKCRIILTDAKKKRLVSHIPVNTTLKDVFLKHVDIRSHPKKAFLKVLAKYTENEEERSILENLSLPSNSEKYISFISNNGRSLSNLLELFPSCKVPIERILENLPPLQPRPYSISSSPLLENEIHITFSIEYFDKETKGICTGWLESVIQPTLENQNSVLPQHCYIPFYFRKPNSFRLNLNIDTPIIMIGPGTALAPFIGFLQHFSLQQKLLYTWLFYGCRYKNRDYLYKSNLDNYIKGNYLSKLSVAISREDDRLHVQDVIIRESEQLYEKLVMENASVYVCGDAKNMMKSVKESIKKCLINNGMTDESASLFISDMIKMEKYVEDQWI